MNDLTLVPIEEIREQVRSIQQLQSEIMVEATEKNPNGHYGKIPGCGDKPALLKAGAEKLALCFNLDLQTETEVIDIDDNGHREYRCVTMVYSKGSGNRLGNGAGSATTMETKWRYRTEATGEEVPKKYWETREPSLIGGSQFSTRKMGSKWMIMHKVEHDNPADYYNTCQKMAEKRSKVCAVLNVTAASDIFIQEDIEHGETETERENKKGPVKKTQSKSSQDKTQPAGEVITTIGKITPKDGKKPHKILGEGDVIYGTYSDSIVAMAQTAMESGLPVRITTKGDKWNTIETIDIVDEQADDAETQTEDAYADAQ